ncbi:MAG: phospholipase D family protein [Chitinophagaceae bacterium]|nr:phospholipase D family protein [Chitinophagaceae bacterium]
MAKFITGKELIAVIDSVIWDAEEQLIIVSPYVKLDAHFKTLFEKHKERYDLHICIVFGKNDGNTARSMSKADFEFFTGFNNVSIIHESNLHAKYYGNELMGVVTSINLYDHSFQNNIEFGVLLESKLLDGIFSASADILAWEEAQKIADNGEVVFIKRPVVKSGFFTNKEIGARVLYDNTESFFTPGARKKNVTDRLGDFPDKVDADDDMPVRASVAVAEKGYCIRTGKEIPFNPKRPYSAEAYQSWAAYKNPDYKEKYCHKTGKPSNGKTSMKNPIL